MQLEILKELYDLLRTIPGGYGHLSDAVANEIESTTSNLTKNDFKIIHTALQLSYEFEQIEAITKDLIAKVHKNYIDIECPVIEHLERSRDSSRYDLTENTKSMFLALKQELDSDGYAPTLDHYKGIKLDNTAAKIQLIKDGQTDSKEYTEVEEMLAVTEVYLMILKSPQDMFLLGEV